MRLATKDSAGIIMVVGTVAALLLHGNDVHLDTHLPPVVDAGGATTSPATAPTFAFVDFNVVPMDGQGTLRHQIVLVRDGFVSQIGPVGVIAVPAAATVVDGDGSRYLVPGLVDAHVHLEDAREDFLPLFLASGVTTIFNLRGDERHIALRDRSRDPDFVGPTIFTSGPFVDDGVVRSPDDARRTVETQARAGYDFVKIHGNLSADSYAALTETAQEMDIAVVGHAPPNLPFSAVLEHAQVGVVHAEELIYTGLQSLDPDQAMAVALQMARAGTWLTPTLSTFANITAQWASPEGLAAALEEPEVRYLPPSLRHAWERSDVWVGRPVRERARIGAMYAFHGPLIRAMDAAGVGLLTGTDTPLPGMVPGTSLHDEMAALQAIGLPPDHVLTAATANAGRFIRDQVDPAASFGTIAVGGRADIIMVEGDPLDDLYILRRPLGVMARGTWYERAALDRMLSLASSDRIADETPHS
jgi:imidazolonepropionase-like amidohydrolase